MNVIHNTRKIYLVRHCRPVINSSKKMCIGKIDIALSDAGKEHAKYLKYFFEDAEFDGIYTSPLMRAMETGKIIAGKKHEIKTVDNFSEIDMGKWDGLSFEEIKMRYPMEYEERGKNFETYIVEGGESMSMCRDRAMAGLYKILNQTQGDILVVTHAGVIRGIMSYISHISMNDIFKHKIQYGSISSINISNGLLIPEEIGLSILDSESKIPAYVYASKEYEKILMSRN